MDILVYFVSFVMISLSAYLIGKAFTRINLPYITGYLLAGALAGPFILDFMPSESVIKLRFVDQISLAIIAFVAGSELFIKDIREQLRSILYSSLGMTIVGMVLGSVAIFLLTQILPFTQGRPFTERLAVALLGATVLLALSPPSTIAVIKEVRARGAFTRTLLSVTVFMDVLIIVLFAITTSMASVLLTGTEFNALFVVFLAIDLSIAVAIGYLVGRLLQLVLGMSPHVTIGGVRMHGLIKTALILLIGYGVYLLSDQVKVISTATLGFEIYIEPLLICLIGGFMVTNFSSHRNEFDELMHDIGPIVYVAFFTLTGISLKLDILLQTLPFAIVLFLVRMVGIYIGIFAASRLAQESEVFKRYAWLGFITQAGIALGLSREVAVQFPSLGTAFATLIISVIVLNEIFGPMLLREALKRAGDANLPDDVEHEHSGRQAVIFGVETQSVALARELQNHGWQVIVADTDASHVEELAAADVDERHIQVINDETLAELINQNTDAIVAMLADDDDNLRVCGFARDKFNISRLVARPHDIRRIEEFRELDVFVVEPASAMISLLEQAVIAPQSAALMLYQDPDRLEIVQSTITNPGLNDLLIRDLRLPSDVLILGIKRDGNSIVPHGYTSLRLYDEITLIGHLDSLEEVTVKLGY